MPIQQMAQYIHALESDLAAMQPRAPMQLRGWQPVPPWEMP
jgi:hypothetical protein